MASCWCALWWRWILQLPIWPAPIYWISHSGLAGCPPAAYSNIVSRIVIVGAELWPKRLRATEYSQRKPELKKIFAAIFPQKPLSSSFSKCVLRGVMRMRWNRLRVRRASLALDCVKKKKDGGKMMASETQARPKTGMKACLDLWYMVLFFFPPLSLFFLSPSHIHLGVKAIDVLPLMAKRGLY